MPVPVPLQSKPPAHPVVKKHFSQDGQSNSFQNLTGTLPVTPSGPPPSFGTREEWINSLPSWRRSKPRRIWEDDARSVRDLAEQHFHQGLAVADNATAIKGLCAEACIPPLFEPETRSYFSSKIEGHVDGEMNSVSHLLDQPQVGGPGRRSTLPARHDEAVAPQSPADASPSLTSCVQPERGDFSPIFDNQSPSVDSGPDVASSPIEPTTPFGVFVDRAVASTDPFTAFPKNAEMVPLATDSADGGKLGFHVPPVYQPHFEVPAPASDVVTPTATSGYKKLAEPLSEWLANFVWKACTTDFRPVTSGFTQYMSKPPSSLATSVHSLLLSTLLQPSAVLLALWYIRRLPVFVGCAADVGSIEAQFRATLFGEGRYSSEREPMDASAPFRLVVLGCMLANKWLDDHTFSNKTWQTISSVPIQTLNKLEFLTLTIFAHDLSISRDTWTQWLETVMAYHKSLTSPSHPQPISRPSANPHSIIRKAIEDILQAPSSWHNDSSHPQPVFIGLEERKREKYEKEYSKLAEMVIDLDEDGPLRQEYLPKRRTSGTSVKDMFVGPRLDEKSQTQEEPLPPPAKWSPAGDEPILRERNRGSGQYVAVQPTPVAVISSCQGIPPTYHPSHEVLYSHQQWPVDNGYMKAPSLPPPLPMGFFLDVPSFGVQPAQQAYNPMALFLPVQIPHSRSQSLSYDQDISQLRNHMRTYSQSGFDYRCSDIPMTANEHVFSPQGDPSAWHGQYAYHAPTLLPHYAWIRT